MAGEGLIWSAVGQGIANAGSTMGQYLMQQESKKEDRAWREEQKAEDRTWRAEQDAKYRRTADDQNAGRAGGGGKDPGIQPADLQPGGKYANMAANKLGMSEADYEKFYASNKSGDLGPYAQKIGTVMDDEYGQQDLKEVPPALKEEFKLKRKMLGDLQEDYALKGNADDVAKGRKTSWQTAMGQSASEKPAGAGNAGQAVAVSEGKPLQNIEGGQQYNQYTGTGATTPLGKAQIAKENAQASELGALGKKYGKDIEKIDAEIQGGMFNKNSSERLTSVVNAANGTIKSLTEGSKGSTPEAKAAWQKSMDDAVAVRDQALALQKGALEAKANPPAPKPDAAKPDAAKPGAAKRGVWDPVAGRIVWK